MSESQRTTEDVVTDHAYDGIQEFDNPLPRWWLMTFYGTVVFSIGYWMAYHSFSGAELPRQAYANEMKRAAEEEDARLAQLEREGKGVTEDQLWALSKDPKTLAAGEALFKQNCVVCHGGAGISEAAPLVVRGKRKPFIGRIHSLLRSRSDPYDTRNQVRRKVLPVADAAH